jgi:ubiquinone biosynthesis protein UbiJ|tara:strand:+ start:21 stop:596 length:576 start_codon:yes stop_codon:yes gene_type:complete
LIQKIKKIILDHLLSQNDWMQTKLIDHKNKVVVIEISSIKLILKIDEKGLLHSLNETKEFDCIIKLTVNDFINQLINKNNGNISIKGDLELAHQVSQVLKRIEWDVEEDLSKYIGDIPATQATKVLKKIVTNSQKNISNISGALLEYWQEENKILTKKRDVEIFNSEVDKIVEDTERLEAKIKKIVEKIKI